MTKEQYLDQALQWVQRRSISSLKAVHDSYEPPKNYINKQTEEAVQADISYLSHKGEQFYVVIALKTENQRNLVSQWKLLSIMATLKRGKLILLAPKGHKMFTDRIVNQYKINAIVYSI